MGDDEQRLLDALMSEHGVTPLPDRDGDPPRSGRPSPQTPRPAASRAPPDADTSDADTSDAAGSAALQAELAAVRAELTALREELAAEATRRTAIEAEASAFDRERRALARQVADLKAAADDGPVPLGVAEAFAQRGIPEDRHAEALATLLLELPTPTLQALDGHALPTILGQRLLLLCEGDACTLATEHAAVLPVPSSDCEVCGGSDMAAAWHRFATACAAHGHRTVVIVGGSPNYRRQLRDLADGHPEDLRLQLVDGRERPRTRRVKGMARQADLVVFWCATIVDHATTNAFVASGVPPVNVPHRGIARMLHWLTDWLHTRAEQR